VALLAAEVSALAAHLNARASAVRALAVDALLEDFSAVTVAAYLGVSRQKVYDLSRASRSDSEPPGRGGAVGQAPASPTGLDLPGSSAATVAATVRSASARSRPDGARSGSISHCTSTPLSSAA
jgi:hypothetical protein